MTNENPTEQNTQYIKLKYPENNPEKEGYYVVFNKLFPVAKTAYYMDGNFYEANDKGDGWNKNGMLYNIESFLQEHPLTAEAEQNVLCKMYKAEQNQPTDEVQRLRDLLENIREITTEDEVIWLANQLYSPAQNKFIPKPTDVPGVDYDKILDDCSTDTTTKGRVKATDAIKAMQEAVRQYQLKSQPRGVDVPSEEDMLINKFKKILWDSRLERDNMWGMTQDYRSGFTDCINQISEQLNQLSRNPTETEQPKQKVNWPPINGFGSSVASGTLDFLTAIRGIEWYKEQFKKLNPHLK